MSNDIENGPVVWVLLSTWNGAKYLPELLDSILAQSYKNIRILVRDDGSTDSTPEVLAQYSEQFSDYFMVERGDNVGVVCSFSTLIGKAIELAGVDDLIMCADQDDCWMPEKLRLTLEAYKSIGSAQLPVLIHSDLQVIDGNGEVLSDSFMDMQKLNPYANRVENLLVQNTVTGCTAAFNVALAKLAYPIPSAALMHDWWLALLASHFGRIEYLAAPLVGYRQHSDNVVGAKRYGVQYVAGLLFAKLRGDDKRVSLTQLAAQAEALSKVSELSSDRGHVPVVQFLADLGNLTVYQRLRFMMFTRLRKHGMLRNLVLWIEVLTYRGAE